MTYELWDAETGNVVNAYDTEAQALAVIREAISRHGRKSVDPLALLRVNARGRSTLVAEAAGLAARALADASADPAPPAARPACSPVPA